jgi:hypothetical protein
MTKACFGREADMDLREGTYRRTWAHRAFVMGIPQGGTPSPLAAKVMLDEFDGELDRAWKLTRRRGGDTLGRTFAKQRETVPDRKACFGIADVPAPLRDIEKVDSGTSNCQMRVQHVRCAAGGFAVRCLPVPTWHKSLTTLNKRSEI